MTHFTGLARSSCVTNILVAAGVATLAVLAATRTKEKERKREREKERKREREDHKKEIRVCEKKEIKNKKKRRRRQILTC